MSTAKLRTGGAWVDTTLAGSVRVAGAWVPFGPGGDPVVTYEAVDWLNPPSLTTGDDGSPYVMGCDFTVSETLSCAGAEWRVPDSITPAPAGGYQVSLWSVSPELQLASTAFTPVAGTTQRILFSAPVSVVAGITYNVSMFTRLYSFRSASGAFPFSSPSGKMSAITGRLTSTSNPNVRAAGNFSSIFYVSPLVEVP